MSVVLEPIFRQEFLKFSVRCFYCVFEFNLRKEVDFIVQLFTLLFILGAGAYYDIREHRIPNRWVVLGIASGIFLGIVQQGQGQFWGADVLWVVPVRFFLRFFIVTAVFFLLFLCRMIGAGDIKLAALICGYLGLKAGALAVGAGFLIGAIWSLFKMMGKRSFLKRFSHLLAYIRQVIQTGKVMPYYIPARDGQDGVIPLGACLFLGTLVYIILQR